MIETRVGFQEETEGMGLNGGKGMHAGIAKQQFLAWLPERKASCS